MHIKIEVDTREPLSDYDKAVLRALAGDEGVPSVPQPATTLAKKAAPAKKAAAAPSPEPEPASEPPEPSPEPDNIEALRDAVGARAADLLANGKREVVIKALKDAGGGAARVGEVEDDHLQAFYDAIA